MARFLCAWDSPGQNSRVGSHSLLQKVFPTQKLNPCRLHCRQILYCRSQQGRGLDVCVHKWRCSRNAVERDTHGDHRNPSHIPHPPQRCPFPKIQMRHLTSRELPSRYLKAPISRRAPISLAISLAGSSHLASHLTSGELPSLLWGAPIWPRHIRAGCVTYTLPSRSFLSERISSCGNRLFCFSSL